MSTGNQRPPAPLFTAACCAGAGVFLADQAGRFTALGGILLPAALAYAWWIRGRQAWLALLLLGAGTLHYWQREGSPSRALCRQLSEGETRSGFLTGTVSDVPEPVGKTTGTPRYVYPFRIETAQPREFCIPGAGVVVHAQGHAPRCGERVRLRAALRIIPSPRNPGQTDMAGLWARRGFWVEAFVSHPYEVDTLAPPALWQPRQWAAQCRTWISDVLGRGIENQPLEHALIASMVLGVRGGGLREAEAWFRETGTLHLFAVSGLNLTMLAWLLSTGFRVTGAGPRLTALLTLPLLALYAVSVGLGPSCCRALVAAILLLGSVWVERPSVAYNNLGAAGLVLLFADTNNLFQGGFQLSFCLVLALLWAAAPLGNVLGRFFHPDPLLPQKLWTFRQRCWVRVGMSLCAPLAASLVAFMAGLPWAYLVFHLVSPVGVLVNLVVIPLAFGVLSLGLLGVCFTPVGPLTPWINRANAMLARALVDVVQFGKSIPGGHWSAANPFVKQPDFVVFDVGSGGAVLVDIVGKPWLLDCGSEGQFDFLLQPGLRFYGLNRLEGLVLSHGDAAHIGGALPTQRVFHPLQVVDGVAKDRSRSRKQLLANWANLGQSPRSVAAGEVLQKAPLPQVEILYPPREVHASLADDKGLVVRVRTKNWCLLYTADAGYPTERWLLEQHPERLQADVWVRGNHLREVTGTDAFVEAVDPKLIVVSGAGRDLEPNRRWAAYWRARGRRVWLQQETGAVEGWAGQQRRVRAFLTGQQLDW